MAFKVIKMCCGGGPSIVRSTMRGVGKSGNGLFMGSIVLLLAWCFVGQCGGKPFHSVSPFLLINKAFGRNYNVVDKQLRLIFKIQQHFCKNRLIIFCLKSIYKKFGLLINPACIYNLRFCTTCGNHFES